MAEGQAPSAATGYGPLVLKGELLLPAAFNYQVVDRQGTPMRDGRPTPGIFDAMGAYPDVGGGVGGNGKRTVLIRNHENREQQPGEIKVVTGPGFEYDETAFGGCTKLVVERERTGERDPQIGQELYEYTVVDNFANLGGTSTNCAGGELPFKKWMTCEEVVKRTGTGENRLKHGYNFEVDAMADGPVVAVPIPQMGRFAHEATTRRSGILYQTEDRSLSQGLPVPVHPRSAGGAVRQLRRDDGAARGPGRQGIAPHEHGQRRHPRRQLPRRVGPGARARPRRRHRQPARPCAGLYAATRFQAQDNGPAIFDRQEGICGLPPRAGGSRFTSIARPGGRRTSVRCGSTTRAVRCLPWSTYRRTARR